MSSAWLAKLTATVTRDVRADLERRWYDASRTNRDTWGWMAGSTSANAEVYGGFVNLRNRSRDLVRNNVYAAKALRVLADNAIGAGITAVARTKSGQA